MASLVSSFNDWQLAEDVLQDAVEQAVVIWRRDGLPDSPAAWLITTAKRKAIDHFRRTTKFTELQPKLTYLIELEHANANEEFDIDSVIPDKRLELIFTCCHPSLDQKTQVALTLRTLGGLTTEEIANAFLDKHQTMAQRLARAKKKIAAAQIPFEVPETSKLQERLSAVLSVIYLIFNEGYAATSGKQITRNDLADEAIRLTRIIMQLLPNQGEVAGLLSLLLLHDSRRFTRQDKNGQMISLEHQNRSAWDAGKIDEGTELLKHALVKQQIGAYQLQAAISAIHAEAATWEQTDWPQIVALYELLYKTQPSHVIRINQAVAISHAYSVETALKMLNELEYEKTIQTYQPFFAARADLNLRNGDKVSARTDFEKAIELSDNAPQIAFLQQRLDNL